MTTTPSVGSSGVSIGAGADVSVTDSANIVVDGISTWSGSFQFSLCKVATTSDTCTSGGTAIGSAISVNQGTVMPITSDTAHVTAAANGSTEAPGRYCWRGDFTSATTGVPNKSDSAATECFIVNPLQPLIPTTASGTVVIGNPVSDSAALSNTANKPGSPVINPTTAGLAAGGTITFRLYGPSATAVCTTSNLVFTSSAIPVNGDGTYSSGNYTPTTVGTYRWISVLHGRRTKHLVCLRCLRRLE